MQAIATPKAFSGLFAALIHAQLHRALIVDTALLALAECRPRVRMRKDRGVDSTVLYVGVCTFGVHLCVASLPGRFAVQHMFIESSALARKGSGVKNVDHSSLYTARMQQKK